MSRSPARRHPPQPKVCVTIAVTGHREIAAERRLHVQAEADRIFHALSRDEGHPHETRLLSQLAAGADQLFAERALAAKLNLQVLLPFKSETYAAGLPGEAQVEFRRLSALAQRTWVAPTLEGDADSAYHLTGMVMLAQADVLIALWDGKPGRGIGGTASVIGQAVREGMPVIHIHPDGGPTRVLWSQFDQLEPERLDPSDTPSRLCDAAALEQIARALLEQPVAEDQRRALAIFLAERERHLRLRFEFPLMLALTGIRALSWRHLLSAPYHRVTDAEWVDYEAAIGGLGLEVRSRFDQLKAAYSWSDRLADHYAQIYRSGTVLNYAAGAIAVLAALAGLLAPEVKPALLVVELVSLAALILNTTAGNRWQWHRRWLDYRYLAEQLRPLRSLKLVGAFGPRYVSGPQSSASASWTDWYASNIWRGLDLPPQLDGPHDVGRVAASVAVHELEPQIAYHEMNAVRMTKLDHRLHRAGAYLFSISLICASIGLAGFILHVELIEHLEKSLTVLGVALPTLGGTLFGIRGHSDFVGAARRSSETAKRLKRTADQLRSPSLSMSRAARLTEDAAQAMAADLGEWRTTFLERKLAIPT